MKLSSRALWRRRFPELAASGTSGRCTDAPASITSISGNQHTVFVLSTDLCNSIAFVEKITAAGNVTAPNRVNCAVNYGEESGADGS